jgi:RimJ/RimL family protein N-acetyltransferase
MNLPLNTCTVRSWDPGDVASMAACANNRKIWLMLRDRFPHPYTARDARDFIRTARKMRPETFFAIAVDGMAIGGIGFVLLPDIERVSAEVGYWLGEPFWGRGIATEALTAVTRYAVAQHGLSRLFALPFAHNTSSCRVLEKAGYVVEGHLRRSAIKDGQIVDQVQYAYVVDGGE